MYASWENWNLRLYFHIMERNFSPHYGREPCENMMLRFDIPASDTREAIQVKDAWEKFQSFAGFIVT